MAKGDKENEDKINTILGDECRLEGEWDVKGGIRIDGYFKGNLKATGSLTVGPQGAMESPQIEVRHATIGGKVTGDLMAPDGVVLQKSSEFTGNICTRLLVIEEGAHFHGSSDMNSIKNPNPGSEPLEDEYIA
ncbi:polymer-forming cytoskeletal protein [bacterium]|nr:polymer-forming cytoskeletal protein [bacterium]